MFKPVHQLLLTLCMCRLLAAAPLWASELEVIYVDMPPYTYLDKNGRASGSLIDISRRALQAVGQPHRFTQVPLAQLQARSRSGDLGMVHLIGAFPIPKQSLSFGERPLSYLRLTVYYRDAAPLKHMADLRGREVILVRGYTYGYLRDYLQIPEQRVNLILVDNHRQALAALRAKPGRYLINYQKPFEFTVGAGVVAGLQHYLLSEIPVYWALQKNYADLLPKLERQLD
ncbi:MAG: transporter substrate-binding domain-containing protein [Cellvibrionaceae bacterium]|nr:transporter substrate-binding domain-containing protein [Cellvibrionaceae bacterium]MCV6628028.1 transporter substrate-binding domain-containing protein [Cellvibrionaceae bacterium]